MSSRLPLKVPRSAAAGPPPVFPLSRSDLFYWFKPEDLAGAGVGANTNWPDASGNGNDLTSAGHGSGFPDIIAAVVDGFSASRGDGVVFPGKMIQMPASFASAGAQPIIIFMVARWVAQNGANSGILGSATAAVTGPQIGTNTTGLQLIAAGSVIGPGPPAWALGTVNLITAIYDGVSSGLQIDGVTSISGDAGTNGFTTGGRLAIHTNFAAATGRETETDILEVMAFAGVSDVAGCIAEAEVYFAAKYPGVPTLPPAPTGTVNFSIGTAAGDIGNGGNVQYSNGNATFDTPQPDNVGIGDEITIAGGSAFISGRSSSTEYTVTNGAGNLPPDILIKAFTPVISITRAFASLTAAQAGSFDASHINSTNLLTAGVILQWPVYNDGAIDDGDVAMGDLIDTGPSNYIRCFAPSLSSDVGISQRHTGLAGTGARFVYTADLSNSNLRSYRIETEYFRLEGLEFDCGSVTNARGYIGIRIINIAATCDILIDGCIVHDVVNGPTSSSSTCRFVELFDAGDKICIKNCFFYNLVNNSTGGGFLHPFRIDSSASSSGDVFLYNCTFYFMESDDATKAGIQNGSSGTLTVRNCYAGGQFGTASDANLFSSIDVEDHNVSSDDSASGTGSVIDEDTFASYFDSITPGSEDLHLLNDTPTIWVTNGVDLAADPDCPVTQDIDLDARAVTPDIGGDEF